VGRKNIGLKRMSGRLGQKIKGMEPARAGNLHVGKAGQHLFGQATSRKLKKNRKTGGLVWPAAFALLSVLPAAGPFAQTAGQPARVKDVASIEGIRDNQLVGYGLVVGLHGTGDSSQTVFPAQTLLSVLERMGITVPQTGSNSASNMQVKNMAGVFVVATLPPFSQPGSKLDVTVSSAGDARTLEGGILLMTPLYGPDGQIFAEAQGALVLGGYMAAGGGSSKQMNHPTTARIPGGALVERPVAFDLKQMHTVTILLNDADFHTAERMSSSIDDEIGQGRARAVDSRRIEIAVNADEDVAGLLDKVESVEVEVYPRARVVVNERTGTVVIGGTVRLQPVSILHGGLSVNVISTTEVSQPNPMSAAGTTQVVQQNSVQAQDRPVNRIDLKMGATVEDLVGELQRTGAGARDVISILQAMKEAGALEADLEVL
jgi:flagellar P-ring protein precursor FlgI